MSADPILLLTRPQAQAQAFAAAVARRHPGLSIVISPVMEIRHRSVRLPEGARGLILTSQNALAAMPKDARGLPVWCVGTRTAAAAEAHGLTVMAAAPDAATLMPLLLAARPEGLVHLAGAHRAVDVAGALGAQGIAATTLVAYDQCATALSQAASRALNGRAPVLLPLFSPRSARLVGTTPITAPLRIAAMSQTVAQAWPGPAAQTMRIAAIPTSEAMLHALTMLADPGGGA